MKAWSTERPSSSEGEMKTKRFADQRSTEPYPQALSWPHSLLSLAQAGAVGCAGMIEYLLLEEDSPLVLELHRDIGEKIPWREAFEDLLLASHGRELPLRERGRRAEESSTDWISRMTLCHSWSAKPAWDHLFDEATARLLDLVDMSVFGPSECPRQKDGPETELDYYLRSEHSDSLPSGSSLPTPTSPSTDDPCRPSVLSTLTTTERTTDPDGTVRTRVVLKKRFSDGTEENKETVHTGLAGQKHSAIDGSEVSHRDSNNGIDEWDVASSGSMWESPSNRRTAKGVDRQRQRGWFWTS